ELLDRLVNNAGEVSIYRSRLEQQNVDLGFNLSELEQTVDRLREQLRHLEIETEAQILFRYEKDKEEGREIDESFDPLELDRFSTMQQLSRSLIETVNDLANIKDYLGDQHRETETLLLQQSRLATDLQDGLLRTRMVPFAQVVPRLHRVIRQTCNPVGKKAALEVQGAEGELDRGILDRMIGPLEHILRNAVSHGIETPQRRQEVGKPEAGRIQFTLQREGNDVLLTVSDDGAGIKVEAIRQKAIEQGILDPNADVTDNDVLQFVLEHGFSTADEVTQIAGRGVGLDVVVSEVKQLGGSLDIQSEPGQGTSFIIRLPLTLAIADAMMVELNEEVFAIPHVSIEGVVRISYNELQACYSGTQKSYSYAGQEYQVRNLGGMLGYGHAKVQEQRKWFPLLLIRAGEHHVALQVDNLLGNRQIVVKSVGPQLSTVRWISGGTILGDGRVALILDVTALVRMDVAHTAVAPVEAIEEDREPGFGRMVMVVDDSITVRKVTGRLLERHGMIVVTAKDGVDAVAQLQEHRPDIMLLDIEMPRMDGYELARHMRNSEELRDIPIIMITSRTGEKHRNLAMELGVKRYLGKPYQESDLLENINSVLLEEAQ
ncbi:MAG: response regulator, partial [Sedimenticola sp.]